MAIDPILILNNYTIIDGRLHRQYPNGIVKLITSTMGNKLVTMLEGRRYYGPDIAWICHHLFPCPFPVVTVDMDPHNLSVENVMPVTRRRLVFRPIVTKYGTRHPMDKKSYYLNREQAFKAWLAKALTYYREGLAYTLAMGPAQQVLDAVMKARQERLATTKRFVDRAKGHTNRPRTPDVPEGMECHWYKDQWVVIPKAVHCSDDWMVRAEACLKNPQARFRYDPALERTVTVDA